MVSRSVLIATLMTILAAPSGLCCAAEAENFEDGSYYVIPVKGVIGQNFTAPMMEKMLDEAEKLSPDVVLLEVDTGGGSTSHAEKIIDLIIQRDSLRFVALVNKALSAGAAITLACREIYISERATIGGAVSYMVGADGLPVRMPEDVAEKHQSIWRATCRKAAEHGGHPSIIADAMIDPGFALTMQERNGKPFLQRNGSGETLKAEGQVLTMTAREAVACGLAEEMVEDDATLCRSLGFAKWERLGRVTSGDRLAGASAAEHGSSAWLYETLHDKATSLRLTEEQTSLEEERAQEEWGEWLQSNNIVGKRVKWTISLVEARERDSESLKRSLESANRNLERAKQRAGRTTKVSKGIVSYQKRSNPRAREQVEHYSGRALLLRRLLFDVKSYPFEVAGWSAGEPRLLVVAYVSKHDEDEIAKVAHEEPVTLAGKVADVGAYVYDEGLFIVVAAMEKCRVSDKSDPKVTDGQDSEAEQKCPGWLSMAKNYLRAGLPRKALTYLQKVLDNYPESRFAEKAKSLKEIAVKETGASDSSEGDSANSGAEGENAPHD